MSVVLEEGEALVHLFEKSWEEHDDSSLCQGCEHPDVITEDIAEVTCLDCLDTRLDDLKDEENLTPEDLLVNQDLKRRLKEVINELPERKKLIMALYFYEELTLADIGRVLDLTEARISQILNKTLIEVKTRLDQ